MIIMKHLNGKEKLLCNILKYIGILCLIFMLNMDGNTILAAEDNIEVASSGDAVVYPEPDLSNYLSIESATEYFSETYIMLVSIRNCLVVLIGFILVIWAHHVIKSIIYKIGGGFK